MTKRSSLAPMPEPSGAAVSALLARAVTEPTGLVIIGEAGIGKTTLWLSACREARAAGFRVLSARGDPSEVRLAFAALADLLGDVDQAVIDALPPVQRGGLNRILMRGNDGSAADEHVAAAAFQAVIHRLSEDHPILIAIDDVQWLDTASGAAVRFAARRLTGPVGVLVTARTGDPTVADATSWLQLTDPDAVTRHRMAPLTFGGLHALISTRLGHVLPRPTMSRIHEISAGNPLYALELARAVADGRDIDQELPDTLAALVRERVRGVDVHTSRLLLAVACTTDPTVESVATATGTQPQRVAELLESGAAARIVVITGHRIRFSHPLMATGVYTGADLAERRQMHRRLADCVDAPEMKARHLASAAVSGDDATLNALDAAAALTREKGAPTAAAELLELAIGLGGDTPIRRTLAAQHHFQAGSILAARQHLEGTADRSPPGPIRGGAVLLQGAINGYDGSFTAAVDAFSAGVAELADVPELRLRGLMLLAVTMGLTERLDEAVEIGREAIRCADGIGRLPLRSHARAGYLVVNFLNGRGVDDDTLRDALRWQGDTEPVSVNMRADVTGALLDSWIGELDRARSVMAKVKRQCSERGSEADLLWVDSQAIMIEVWAADYRGAALIAEEQERRAEQLGGHYAELCALTCRAAVAAYTGQVDLARSTATTAAAMAIDTGGVNLAAYPTATLGFLEVSLGNHQAALDALAAPLAAFDPERGTEIVLAGWLPDAIEALTSLGRCDDARDLVTALRDNGTRMDRPWMLAIGARGQALREVANGDLAAAERTAVEALKHHQRLPMPFETARTRLLLGQIQRRRRRRQEALRTLSDALRAFETIGTPLWAERARSELARLTGTERSAGSGLTPAEQRIAQRAAAGLSNKEIAAELFVAVKTVEMTLSSVYRKLGIRSRAQLHSRLSEATTAAPPERSR